MRTPTRPARETARYISYSLAIAIAIAVAPACDTEPDPTVAVGSAPGVLQLEPRRDETRVPLEHEISILFDRPLSDAELDVSHFTVNGEPAAVLHDRYDTVSRITLTPSNALDWHEVYTVRVWGATPAGLPAVTWRFATDPGPAGELWERIDSPTGADLLDVVETSSGFVATGTSGTVLRSGFYLDWGGKTYALEVDGAAYTGTLVSIWPGSGSSNWRVLTAGGEVLVGRGFSFPWTTWDPPDDLHARDIWGIADIIAGSLRSDPSMGFVTSTRQNAVVIVTGQGRVMRSVSPGYDGDNYYLAVGDEGTVFFTRDGVDWEDVHHDPSLGSLHAVRAGYPGASPATQLPRISVAAGDGLAWSEDGRSWNAVAMKPRGTIHDLSWDGYPLGVLVAAGESATLLRSTDGKVWQQIDTGIDIGDVDFYGVWVYGSEWVVVGEGGLTLHSPPHAIEF